MSTQSGCEGFNDGQEKETRLGLIYNDEAPDWTFDPNNMPRIEDIDLVKLTELEPRLAGKDELHNPRKTVRYLLEAAEGSMDNREFSNIFTHTLDEIRTGLMDGTEIGRLWDELEEHHRNRILDLLIRCNRENIFTPGKHEEVTRYCIVATTFR